MNFNWSRKDDKILIEFVRIHEALYNIKSKDYRKTQLKQKLWCKIGTILNKTDSDCSKRWSYVRDYYIRRKGKSGTGSSGEAAKNRSELLSFLDNLPSSQRNSITNIVKANTPEENTQDNSVRTPIQIPETEEIIYDNNKEYNEGDSNGDKNSKYGSIKGGNYEDINKYTDRNIKSDKKRKNISQDQECLSLLKQIVQGKPSTQNNLDETDLFFSSMAKIVKRLPRYEQAQLRMQIGSLVGNAELRHISNDLPRSSISAKK